MEHKIYRIKAETFGNTVRLVFPTMKAALEALDFYADGCQKRMDKDNAPIELRYYVQTYISYGNEFHPQEPRLYRTVKRKNIEK